MKGMRRFGIGPTQSKCLHCNQTLLSEGWHKAGSEGSAYQIRRYQPRLPLPERDGQRWLEVMISGTIGSSINAVLSGRDGRQQTDAP
ncbi:MAG: hypothetical protein AB9879_10105 [Methanothrix sp.]